MNWIVTIVILLVVVLVGAMFYAMPWLTRPTIPLGVSIPSTRVDEPVVRRAVKRYCVGIVIVTIVSVLLALVGEALPPLAGALLPIVVVLVGTLIVYLSSRRLIQQAKRDGDWYRDVPVRLTASITSSDRPLVAPAIGWYVAGVVVLMAAIVIGAVVYDSLPNPLPVHWNAEGVPTGSLRRASGRSSARSSWGSRCLPSFSCSPSSCDVCRRAPWRRTRPRSQPASRLPKAS